MFDNQLKRKLADDNIKLLVGGLEIAHAYEVLVRNGFDALGASENLESLDPLHAELEIPLIDSRTSAGIIIKQKPSIKLMLMSYFTISERVLATALTRHAIPSQKRFDGEVLLRELKRILLRRLSNSSPMMESVFG